ncbi:neurofilament heavy polypeptide-like [Asbolus verrucosus]|uniref:Neurofilament heavy polypeptide-like n=1 Tax=Asbolus verrucosus TaxID=1661398 RepID=A0A482W294_ASBVE|nr:neurofilament heavy polypeptide-like [Asbolus verrucosus]
MTPATRVPQESHEEAPDRTEEQPTFRYNVCQPRTSPVEKPSSVGDLVAAQKQSVKAAIEQQQLQPAMLPEYFQKQMERNALIHPEPEPSEENRINKGHSPNGGRRFQVSKTYANAILPLKSVKLANPFPEPVKMMMSRTVSDDEKAEQMLAESRSQRNFSDWGKAPQMPPYRNFSTEVKRWYSKTVGVDSDKCKKMSKAKKSCPKMKLGNCPPPARQRCDRLAKHIDCKKQEAPYPAYSEFCHEEIEEKPSECKLCPWKAEDNPNFKPQKKKIHTSASTNLKRSGLEMDWSEYISRVEEEPRTAAHEDEPIEGMQCDLRKVFCVSGGPQCERPKNRRCPPKEKDKRAKKQEERKKKPKGEYAGAKGIGEILELQDNQISLKQKSRHGPCKIRKFKFPTCDKKPAKKEETDHCHKKKKKPKIIDCPDEKQSGCLPPNLVVEEYSFSGEKHDKSKCPKVDLTINRPAVSGGVCESIDSDSVFKEEDDDPCKLKRKGNTKVCPGDLLKKKRRKPKKKTSGIITPVESNKTEPPQPTTRMM